jgi:hypothetical protein
LGAVSHPLAGGYCSAQWVHPVEPLEPGARCPGEVSSGPGGAALVGRAIREARRNGVHRSYRPRAARCVDRARVGDMRRDSGWCESGIRARTQRASRERDWLDRGTQIPSWSLGGVSAHQNIRSGTLDFPRRNGSSYRIGHSGCKGATFHRASV